MKYIGVILVVGLVSAVGAYFQYLKEEKKKAAEGETEEN